MTDNTQPQHPPPETEYCSEFLGRAGRLDVWGDRPDAISPLCLVYTWAHNWWGPNRGPDVPYIDPQPTPHEWCLIYEHLHRYTAGIPPQPEGN